MKKIIPTKYYRLQSKVFSIFHWRIYGQELNYQLCNQLFGCKQCFRYSNGECNPNLDIYFWKPFQQYKVGLAIWTMLGSPNLVVQFQNIVRLWLPKWKSTCKCGASLFYTFSHLWGCMDESPYTLSTCFPCHVLTLFMSPKLTLQQWPREWKFKSHFVHVIIVIYISKYNLVDVARKLDDALWVQQSIDNLTIFWSILMLLNHEVHVVAWLPI